MFCSVEDWRRKRRGEIQEADCRDYHKWHTSQPGQNTALGRPQITIKSGSQAVRLLHKAFHSRGPAMLEVKTASTKILLINKQKDSKIRDSVMRSYTKLSGHRL